MENNLSLKKQITILTKFLMQKYPEKIINGGAVETVIQILTNKKTEREMIIWIAEYCYKKANSESKMNTPSIVYEQVEKDFKKFLND